MRLSDELLQKYDLSIKHAQFRALEHLMNIDVGFIDFPTITFSDISTSKYQELNNNLFYQNKLNSPMTHPPLFSDELLEKVKTNQFELNGDNETASLSEKSEYYQKSLPITPIEITPELSSLENQCQRSQTPTCLALFDQSTEKELKLESNQAAGPVRIKSSLYLQTFYSDFNLILSYCLNPLQYDLLWYQSKVNKYSFTVMKLIDKHRLKELRKEQKIKKILNLSFKILIRNFVTEKFPTVMHISENIKKQFCLHYFKEVSHEKSLFTKPDYRCKKSKNESRPLNLTYNSRFFETIQRCPSFLEHMIRTLNELEEIVVQTVRTDVRRILKRIELCVFSVTDGNVSLETLENFFSKKNQLGNKLGIKIPWTQNQIKESIRMVRNLIIIKEKR